MRFSGAQRSLKVVLMSIKARNKFRSCSAPLQHSSMWDSSAVASSFEITFDDYSAVAELRNFLDWQSPPPAGGWQVTVPLLESIFLHKKVAIYSLVPFEALSGCFGEEQSGYRKKLLNFLSKCTMLSAFSTFDNVFSILKGHGGLALCYHPVKSYFLLLTRRVSPWSYRYVLGPQSEILLGLLNFFLGRPLRTKLCPPLPIWRLLLLLVSFTFTEGLSLVVFKVDSITPKKNVCSFSITEKWF